MVGVGSSSPPRPGVMRGGSDGSSAAVSWENPAHEVVSTVMATTAARAPRAAFWGMAHRTSTTVVNHLDSSGEARMATSKLQRKAAIDPEYLRVDLRDRDMIDDLDGVDVLIDGEPGGKVGRLLLVSYGTWTVSVDLPGAIPQVVSLAGTKPSRPEIVVIDVEG